MTSRSTAALAGASSEGLSAKAFPAAIAAIAGTILMHTGAFQVERLRNHALGFVQHVALLAERRRGVAHPPRSHPARDVLHREIRLRS